MSLKARILPLFALMLIFTGCYDMTIRINSLPENTPPSDNIYISGNFNNWDPGDPEYLMVKNQDSIYEVHLPKGIGEVEFKFTRGDWSTVEKDLCGGEIENHRAFYGRKEIIDVDVESWNDLQKPKCPKVVIVIDSLPPSTPNNSTLFIAGSFNGWDPGNRSWSFNQTPEGKYYIEIPRPNTDWLEYKITRGNWDKVETDTEGNDIDNRILRERAGYVVYIKVEGWKDR